MNIIWISNVIFPEACDFIGLPTTVLGGWMHSGAKALIKQFRNVKLTIISLYPGDNIKKVVGDEMNYYLVPQWPDDQYYNPNRVKFFKEIYDEVQPDIVHIHGTEFPHSLESAIACDKTNYVVSIQGLAQECCKYYNGGIPQELTITKYKGITKIKQLIKKKLNINPSKTPAEEMYIRGLYENELIQKSSYIIGRTKWDYAHSTKVNSNIKYYHCNENLRSVFYNKAWRIDTCQKKTIFISQASYPLKGFHKLIEAIPLIARNFPDVKVFVAGADIINDKAYENDGYAIYLKKLISNNNVSEKINFVGKLDEETMACYYQKSHVFICPSSIENSSNSIGEAQLVGTPCIASYVGGNMDMIEDKTTGLLYQFEDSTMLAQKIVELFSSDELCNKLSQNERIVSHKRHDRETNSKRLYEIYNDITNSSCQNN